MEVRKVPVTVQAWQYTGMDDGANLPEWVREGFTNGTLRNVAASGGTAIIVKTMEGDMALTEGNYLMQGIKGELYPCAADIFEMTYEIVTEGGWYGFDLDGTLAEYDGWKGLEHIGAPIRLMVKRLRSLAKNRQVKIFTARVAGRDRTEVVRHIDKWCMEHIGFTVPVTNVKDFGMVHLWDDRCTRVEANTGREFDCISDPDSADDERA